MSAAQNLQVIKELEALIEKVGYGVLDCTFDLHNKRVTAVTIYGKRRDKYNRDNLAATRGMLDRIKQSADRKDTTKLTFVVDIRNGAIEEILLLSKIVRKYDQ